MADLRSFTENVKHLFDLQDSMKLLAAEVKLRREPIKAEIDAVQDKVKEFMKRSEIDVANYHDERIELQTVTRYGSLTQKSLKAALFNYFQDEAKSEEAFQSVVSFLGSRELQVLKRLKNRKRKQGAAPPGAPPPPMDDAPPELSDEDDD